MTLPIGHVVHNRYRIARLVGQGGFGAVYRAWDLSLSQAVALKENIDSGVESQRQFEREATLLASLRHPNLPRVIDHFIIPDQGQYLVMDFVEGQSLAQIMRERGRPLSEGEAREWIRQVCQTVQYLHSRTPPIIHRDIKPDNIIVTEDGRAMLVDFGISKLYEVGRGTTTGARAITPGYSPPEQYGMGKTDTRSDVYALGATLYNLLTGQTPPEAIDLITGTQTLPPPRQANPTISEAAAQAIVAAMIPSASQRVESVARFEQILTGRATPPQGPGIPPQGPATPPQGPTMPPQGPALPPTEKTTPSRGRQGCMLGGVAIAGLVLGGLVMLGILIWVGLALIEEAANTLPTATADRFGGGVVLDDTPVPTWTPEPPTPSLPTSEPTYTEYVNISDDANVLFVDVPVEWSDVDGSNWIDSDDGSVLGSALTASPDIAAFNSSYATPGLDMVASRSLTDRSLDELLVFDSLSTDCTYVGRFDYSDVAYTGIYDEYSNCLGEGNTVIVMAVEPQGRAYVIRIWMQMVTPADLEAFDRMTRSFVVLGTLPGQ